MFTIKIPKLSFGKFVSGKIITFQVIQEQLLAKRHDGDDTEMLHNVFVKRRYLISQRERGSRKKI